MVGPLAGRGRPVGSRTSVLGSAGDPAVAAADGSAALRPPGPAGRQLDRARLTAHDATADLPAAAGGATAGGTAPAAVPAAPTAVPAPAVPAAPTAVPAPAVSAALRGTSAAGRADRANPGWRADGPLRGPVVVARRCGADRRQLSRLGRGARRGPAGGPHRVQECPGQTLGGPWHIGGGSGARHRRCAVPRLDEERRRCTEAHGGAGRVARRPGMGGVPARVPATR